MDIDEYQKDACSFATKGGNTLVYSILEIAEELGELCERVNFTDLDVFGSWSVCSEAKTALAAIRENKKLCGRIAKKIRKEWDSFKHSERQALTTFNAEDLAPSECGDILWGVANVAAHLGSGLGDVAGKNISKLSERKNTNTIIGAGETVEERKANG